MTREEKAAKILGAKLGLRCKLVGDVPRQSILAYDEAHPEDAEPTWDYYGPHAAAAALVVRGPEGWGALAPWPLQGQILDALNGHA